MKRAAISELKAKLSRYLRLVKSGEDVEIQERGIPIAMLTAIRKESPDFLITRPRKDAGLLGQRHFSVKPKNSFDSLSLLLEDRKKR